MSSDSTRASRNSQQMTEGSTTPIQRRTDTAAPHDGSSEVEFRRVFEDAPIGIYQSTLEGRFVRVNPRLAEMLGYETEEELLRLDLDSDVYYIQGERGQLIREFFPARVARQVEVRWKKKSGDPIWVSLSTYAVVNQDGSVRYFEGFVNDITQRKEAEEKLLQREEYFRSIIENSVDAVVLIDAEGRIEYAAQKDAVGFRPDEIVGEPFFARIHPDDQEFAKQEFRGFLTRAGGQMMIKVRARRESGEWRHLEIVARNLLDNPAVNAIVANFRDVTDRVIAEDRLAQSEFKYRQIIEQASDGIIIVGPDGILQYVNEKFCQMTG